MGISRTVLYGRCWTHDLNPFTVISFGFFVLVFSSIASVQITLVFPVEEKGERDSTLQKAAAFFGSRADDNASYGSRDSRTSCIQYRELGSTADEEGEM